MLFVVKVTLNSTLCCKAQRASTRITPEHFNPKVICPHTQQMTKGLFLALSRPQCAILCTITTFPVATCTALGWSALPVITSSSQREEEFSL